MVTKQELEAKLKTLDPTHLEVIDTSDGCGQSFEVVIVSSAFEGKNTIQRHRTINTLLKEEIQQIHAFSQKCYTPAEYTKK
jgi:stress-induced morphogen